MMANPTGQRYVRGTVCALVVVPLLFLAVYPLLTLILPERLAILTDLPQDLTLVLIADGVVVPLLGVALYIRARRRGDGAGGSGSRDRHESRDVF